MVKRAIKLVVVISFVFALGMSQTTSKKDHPILEMATTKVVDFDYTSDDLPIDITFRNNQDSPVRILNVFDDINATRVFFTIVLRDTDGTPFGPFGGGKISLLRKSIKYVELKKGDEFKLRINLKDFLPKNASLKLGEFDVSITYFNQYGEDCFKGRLEAEKIMVSLAPSNR